MQAIHCLLGYSCSLFVVHYIISKVVPVSMERSECFDLLAYFPCELCELPSTLSLSAGHTDDVADHAEAAFSGSAASAVFPSTLSTRTFLEIGHVPPF